MADVRLSQFSLICIVICIPTITRTKDDQQSFLHNLII